MNKCCGPWRTELDCLKCQQSHLTIEKKSKAWYGWSEKQEDYMRHRLDGPSLIMSGDRRLWDTDPPR